MANLTPASRPKKSRIGLYLIVGLVLLILLGGGVAVKNRGQAKVTSVAAGEVITRTITQLVTATGKVRPETEVKIVPEVSGEIVELPFREGASVKKGDLLLRIKDDNYRYLLDQREADLAAARAATQAGAAVDKERVVTDAALRRHRLARRVGELAVAADHEVFEGVAGVQACSCGALVEHLARHLFADLRFGGDRSFASLQHLFSDSDANLVEPFVGEVCGLQ